MSDYLIKHPLSASVTVVKKPNASQKEAIHEVAEDYRKSGFESKDSNYAMLKIKCPKCSHVTEKVYPADYEGAAFYCDKCEHHMIL